MKILVVEDNKEILNNISCCLEMRFNNLNIIPVNNKQDAEEITRNKSPDLVIIDPFSSNVDILPLISGIRHYSEVPIIVLSESETDVDRVRGLEAGADEYISRQFNPVELLAQCRALLRRCKIPFFGEDSTISVSGLTLNFENHEVLKKGQPLKLTPIEFRLLAELLKNRGRLIRTGELLNKVWGPNYAQDNYLVKIHVYRLRSKLQSVAGKSPKIVCERGVGYRLVEQS